MRGAKLQTRSETGNGLLFRLHTIAQQSAPGSAVVFPLHPTRHAHSRSCRTKSWTRVTKSIDKTAQNTVAQAGIAQGQRNAGLILCPTAVLAHASVGSHIAGGEYARRHDRLPIVTTMKPRKSDRRNVATAVYCHFSPHLASCTAVTAVERNARCVIAPQIAGRIVPLARKHRGRKTGEVGRGSRSETAGNPFGTRTERGHAQGVTMGALIERTMQADVIERQGGITAQTRIPQCVGGKTGETPCSPSATHYCSAQKLCLIGR